MLTLAWRYLAGRAVATDVADRSAPEWPPHPDRVFQALVDAWGALEDSPGREAATRALEWLERQAPPALSVPGAEVEVWRGAAPKVYVPTNDAKASEKGGKYADGAIALMPSFRTRKERRFQAMVVGDGACALAWDAEPGEHRAALAALAASVTRIGHSSSLVRCWLEAGAMAPAFVPAGLDEAAELSLRVPGPGRLRALREAYADGGERWQRPPTAGWVSYRAAGPVARVRGDNAGRLVILRRLAGRTVDLERTVELSRRLRGALLRRARGPAVALVSGHAADGAALDRAHVGFVPLPFVGSGHADGHLLGVGVLMPAGLAFDAEDAVLQALADALDPETGTLTLSLGDGREVTFGLEERPAPPRALRAGTWARGSHAWATVTPVVLDRMPSRGERDRDAFVEGEVRRACERVGLPAPAEVVVGDVSMLEGAPHAAAFPGLPTKAGLRRRHVHVWLRFDVPVAGPLVLGAGRYLGMGLFRPVADAVPAADPAEPSAAKEIP